MGSSIAAPSCSGAAGVTCTMVLRGIVPVCVLHMAHKATHFLCVMQQLLVIFAE
jgi:hypothetical protein